LCFFTFFVYKIWYFDTDALSLRKITDMEKLRIKELLKEKGLSMKDLADKTGLDQSNLVKSLSNNPKLSTLQEVAKALRVEMHELFNANSPSGPTGIAIIGGRSYAMMAMPTVIDGTGVHFTMPEGTETEMADLQASYEHLCAMRDEIIEMGVIPPISDWKSLNPNL
jgi:malate dehydrogenase